MRFVRLLGVAIIIYGLAHMRHAVTQLYQFFTESIVSLSNYILFNLNIGLVTFILGIGLLLTKEWARISWLMSTIALLAVHIVILVFPPPNLTEPILNFVIILLLSLVSWTKLTRPSVKELFS